MVTKFKTDPFELFHIKQLWQEWKSELQSFYLKLEFQLSNSLGKENSSSSHNSSFEMHFEHLNEYLKHYLTPSNLVCLADFSLHFILT